jgi:hypothetical protein
VDEFLNFVSALEGSAGGDNYGGEGENKTAESADFVAYLELFTAIGAGLLNHAPPQILGLPDDIPALRLF